MDYITAIGTGFPGVNVQCFGDPMVYADIEWVSGLPLPSKQTLDDWILSNGQAGGNTRITKLAFRNRFTAAEKVTIEIASLDNPSATIEQRQMAASLRVYVADVQSSTFVDLARSDTRAGVQSLETNGIIGVGRAAEILDTPPAAHELT